MPKALGMASAVMAAIGFLPGIPFLPFFGLAAGAAYMAHTLSGTQKRAADKAGAGPAAAAATAAAQAAQEEPITESLRIDDLKIEIGYALLPLVNSPDGSDRLTEQIKALRRTLASEMGFVMPSVRIHDNVQLEANAYLIKVKEVDAGQGQVFPGQFMAIDPMGGLIDLPGQHTMEPTFGLPATWLDASLREEAQLRGYTVVDAATVVSTHLTEILKANVSELLSYVELQKLIRELSKEHTELVKDLVPTQIAMTGIQRVLQNLLAERVSIRDLGTILEGIADAVGSTRNPRDITEIVRQRLARQICAQYSAPGGQLPIITLSPAWESVFAESIVGQGDERHLAMQPSRLHEFVTTVRDRFEEAARQGEMPVLVTSAATRPFARTIIERFRRETPILSQSEIHPRIRLKTVGSV
jgi:flagellar biosynthesis protein FlhA